MTLMQICEPGEAVISHQYKFAVGIDLGTTYSLVAVVRNGAAEIISDEYEHSLMPSVVRYLPNNQIEVGHQAVLAKNFDPKNTIFSVKRLMGRSLNDIPPDLAKLYKFTSKECIDERLHATKIALVASGMVKIQTIAGNKSPVEVSANILMALRKRAEQRLGQSLVGAVITVPAYFDDAQRQATKDAAQLAGLHVLRLLSEPTAAAIAYGLENNATGLYAVYDLGGGTFDISILRLERGIFEVLANGGDTALGGDDFDHCLYEFICGTALREFSMHKLDLLDCAKLLNQCRLAKEKISSTDSIKIPLPFGLDDFEISQKQFFIITEHLVNKTIKHVELALKDANVNAKEIKGVILVGGATRMPHVQSTLVDFFQDTPLLNNLNPDQVVALGASLQANFLAGNTPKDNDWLLLDVIPLSLGVETMGGLVEKIIPRNLTIPVARSQEFTTFQDGQSSMSLHIVQGERQLAKDCRSLARLVLNDIPPMPAGAARILVNYQVDADGILNVTARETNSNVLATITVKPSYGLDDGEITKMLEEASQSATIDVSKRDLLEAQMAAQAILRATNLALESDSELLTINELSLIKENILKLNLSLDKNIAENIILETKALSLATDEFAAKRMNKNIKLALVSKKIEQLCQK